MTDTETPPLPPPNSLRELIDRVTGRGLKAVAAETDSGIALHTLKVDGGAVVNSFLMQLQADILGVPVVRPTVSETTALGAAYMAGLATGVWNNLDDLRGHWGVERIFEPQWDQARRAEGYRGWERAVERARGWIEP